MENAKNYNTAEMQPDELNALKALVEEFLGKVQNIDNEIQLLKDDRKELFEEYSDRLDMKTLKAALSIIKIQKGVAHADTFEMFMEVLDKQI
jgi:uncharacterized protein (UPF0335 family)